MKRRVDSDFSLRPMCKRHVSDLDLMRRDHQQRRVLAEATNNKLFAAANNRDTIKPSNAVSRLCFTEKCVSCHAKMNETNAYCVSCRFPCCSKCLSSVCNVCSIALLCNNCGSVEHENCWHQCWICPQCL